MFLYHVCSTASKSLKLINYFHYTVGYSCTKITFVINSQDLVNLAPRKPDWDLKRDVAKKLEKLERRTERAIAELISELRK